MLDFLAYDLCIVAAHPFPPCPSMVAVLLSSFPASPINQTVNCVLGEILSRTQMPLNLSSRCDNAWEITVMGHYCTRYRLLRVAYCTVAESASTFCIPEILDARSLLQLLASTPLKDS